MRRRDFISLVSGAAAWPLAARAQQPAMPVIGFLSSSSPANLITAFRQGVLSLGGRPIRSIARSGGRSCTPSGGGDRRDRLPIDRCGQGGDHDHTDRLHVRRRPGASLNRPGGNVTGVTFLVATLAAKLLGLLRDLLPQAARIAVLTDPNMPVTESFVSDALAAAVAIGKQIDVLNASTGRDIDAVFAQLAQAVDALLVGPAVSFTTRRVQLITLAAYHRVPAIYSFREAAEAGGLMSYGTSFAEAQRQAGIYTGRILKGEKPGDLPIEFPTKVELVVNATTAKAIGVTIPPTLLARADEVIE